MNCFKRAYMCRASRRPLQHLIPPSTSFPQIQETAVQLLLYHKDVDSLADFPRRPSSPLIARVFPPVSLFPSSQCRSLSSGGASRCRCYTLRMTLTRSYLFIYLLILHLRDPLLDVALLWLYRLLCSPFK